MHTLRSTIEFGIASDKHCNVIRIPSEYRYFVHLYAVKNDNT